MNKRTLTLLAAALSTSVFASFTPGNLVVSLVGDATNNRTSAAWRVALREFTTGGLAVGSDVAIPFNGTSKLTWSGTASSEGFLKRSTNGQYLTLVGYVADEGTATIATAAGISRVIGRVDASGGVDLSTIITDGYVGGNIRSAVSSNGIDIWTSGTSNPIGSGGVRYLTFGSSSSVALHDSIAGSNNARVVGIFDLGSGPQLFVSTGAQTTWNGVNMVGTGLPTTSGQSVTNLPGFPGSPGATNTPSPYEFWFKNANTCYVADDRTVANGGGIQRWDFSAGTWTLTYTLKELNGMRGLTGTVNGSGDAVLYAVSAGESNTAGNRLVTVTDTGSASTFTTLATSSPQQVFRGVAFAPEAGSGINTIAGAGTFGDFTGDLTARTFAFKVLDASDTEVASWSQSLSSGGAFSHTLGSPLANGTYTLCVKGDHWLSKKITFTQANATTIAFNPLNGDIDGDDSITVFDYGVLSDYFDKSSGDADWNTVGGNGFAPSAADVDGDEAVTVFDYGIISDNFDKSGDCA